MTKTKAISGMMRIGTRAKEKTPKHPLQAGGGTRKHPPRAGGETQKHPLQATMATTKI